MKKNDRAPRNAQAEAALKLYLDLIERSPDELTSADMQLIERLGALICSFELRRDTESP